MNSADCIKSSKFINFSFKTKDGDPILSFFMPACGNLCNGKHNLKPLPTFSHVNFSKMLTRSCPDCVLQAYATSRLGVDSSLTREELVTAVEKMRDVKKIADLVPLKTKTWSLEFALTPNQGEVWRNKDFCKK